jgi:ribosome-binding protein aMBF1 (putative translation factor)
MKLSEYRQNLLANSDFVKSEQELQLQFEFANAVLRARLKKGWSQANLAEATGTKQANISRIESGLANPTLALIQKIVRALEIRVDFSQTHRTPTVTTTSMPLNSTTAIHVPNWPGADCGPHYETKSQKPPFIEGNF